MHFQHTQIDVGNFKPHCAICDRSVYDDTEPQSNAKVCPQAHAVLHLECSEHSDLCPNPNCERSLTALSFMPEKLHECGLCSQPIDLESSDVSHCQRKHSLVHLECARDAGHCNLGSCGATFLLPVPDQTESTTESEPSLEQEQIEVVEIDHSQRVVESASPVIRDIDLPDDPELIPPDAAESQPMSPSMRGTIAIGVAFLISLCGTILYSRLLQLSFNQQSINIKSESGIQRFQNELSRRATKVDELVESDAAKLAQRNPILLCELVKASLVSDDPVRETTAIQFLQELARKNDAVLSRAGLEPVLYDLFENTEHENTKLEIIKLMILKSDRAALYWIAQNSAPDPQGVILDFISSRNQSGDFRLSDAVFLVTSESLNGKTEAQFQSVIRSLSKASRNTLKHGSFPVELGQHIRLHNYVLFYSELYKPDPNIHPEFNRVPFQDVLKVSSSFKSETTLPPKWLNNKTNTARLGRLCAELIRLSTTRPGWIIESILEQQNHKSRGEFLTALFLGFIEDRGDFSPNRELENYVFTRTISGLRPQFRPNIAQALAGLLKIDHSSRTFLPFLAINLDPEIFQHVVIALVGHVSAETQMLDFSAPVFAHLAGLVNLRRGQHDNPWLSYPTSLISTPNNEVDVQRAKISTAVLTAFLLPYRRHHRANVQNDIRIIQAQFPNLRSIKHPNDFAPFEIHINLSPKTYSWIMNTYNVKTDPRKIVTYGKRVHQNLTPWIAGTEEEFALKLLGALRTVEGTQFINSLKQLSKFSLSLVKKYLESLDQSDAAIYMQMRAYLAPREKLPTPDYIKPHHFMSGSSYTVTEINNVLASFFRLSPEEQTNTANSFHSKAFQEDPAIAAEIISDAINSPDGLAAKYVRQCTSQRNFAESLGLGARQLVKPYFQSATSLPESKLNDVIKLLQHIRAMRIHSPVLNMLDPMFRRQSHMRLRPGPQPSPEQLVAFVALSQRDRALKDYLSRVNSNDLLSLVQLLRRYLPKVLVKQSELVFMRRDANLPTRRVCFEAILDDSNATGDFHNKLSQFRSEIERSIRHQVFRVEMHKCLLQYALSKVPPKPPIDQTFLLVGLSQTPSPELKELYIKLTRKFYPKDVLEKLATSSAKAKQLLDLVYPDNKPH